MRWGAATFDDAAKARIVEASIFERRMRLESLLSIPSSIGPFTLYPLKVGDALALEYGENRLIKGEDPRIDDIVHLLWTVRGNDKRGIKKFSNWVAKNMTDYLRGEIIAFFNVQFNDMPSADGGHTNEYDSSVWLASLIDSICSEYGWTLKELMETPIASSLQLFQRILKRNNPSYAIRNGITQIAKAYEMRGLQTDG
jgi:hypothetical protein